MVFNEAFKNTYTHVRKPGKLFGYDSSKTLPRRVGVGVDLDLIALVL